MKRNTVSMIRTPSRKLERYIWWNAIRDRFTRVPQRAGEGNETPFQQSLADLTRGDLADQGRRYFNEVRGVHDPIVARASDRVTHAERQLHRVCEEEAEAEKAAHGVAPVGNGADPSRQIHRTVRRAQVLRRDAEEGLLSAQSALSEAITHREAAIAESRHEGFVRLAMGHSAEKWYWAVVSRPLLGKRNPVVEVSSSVTPMAWMTEDIEDHVGTRVPIDSGRT